MKLKKEILKIVTLFHKNPCEEDYVCVVRAGCSIKQKEPFFRSVQCPIYKKYLDRERKVRDILNDIIDWFWIIIMGGGGLILITTFILGIVKWYEIFRGLFE